MVAADPARRLKRCEVHPGGACAARLRRRIRAVLLPVFLLELRLSVIAIGAIVTATLIGSALLRSGSGSTRIGISDG